MRKAFVDLDADQRQLVQYISLPAVLGFQNYYGEQKVICICIFVMKKTNSLPVQEL